MTMTTQPQWGDQTTRHAEAALIADAEKTWRDWKAYIKEQRLTLQQRQRDARGATLDDLTGAPADAHSGHFEAAIPAARRREFASVLEQRRRKLQADMEADALKEGTPHPDADEVLDRLLTQIEGELDGKIHPKGYALIWTRGTLHEFDASTVTSASHDDDYLRLRKRQKLTPQQQILIGVGVLVALVALWFLWGIVFPAPAATQSTVTPKLRVGEEEFTPLGASSVKIGGHPLPDAQVRPGYPLFMCVPEKLRSALVPGATVEISSSDNLRVYQVNAEGDGQPGDLLFARCEEGKEPVIGATAYLQTTQTRRYLEGDLLESIAVWKPEIDPQAIPSNQARVDLVLRGEGRRGSLKLGTAPGRAPIRTESSEGTTRLIYLVPAAAHPRQAAWQQASDEEEQGMPWLLPLTLPVAEGRQAWLREHLRVSMAQALVTTYHDGQVEIVLDLTLVSDLEEPLQLQTGDLHLSQAGAEVVWEPPELQTGAPTETHIQALGTFSAPLDIDLGTWFARVNW